MSETADWLRERSAELNGPPPQAHVARRPMIDIDRVDVSRPMSLGAFALLTDSDYHSIRWRVDTGTLASVYAPNVYGENERMIAASAVAAAVDRVRHARDEAAARKRESEERAERAAAARRGPPADWAERLRARIDAVRPQPSASSSR
jgi:hypothetical protein